MNGMAGQIPLKRTGDPKEFAALVAFMASERASFLTGAAIPLDGGAARRPRCNACVGSCDRRLTNHLDRHGAGRLSSPETFQINIDVSVDCRKVRHPCAPPCRAIGRNT